VNLRVILEFENDGGDEWPPEVQKSAEKWARNLVDKRLSGLGRASYPITRRGRTYKAVIAEIRIEEEPD